MGPDALRPLSAKGQTQADEPVARLLQALGVTRLVSSPALRCVQTLAPAASALGLPVETCPELGEKTSVDRLLRSLEAATIEGAALCTHGGALTGLFEAWRGSGRVAFADEGGSGPARTPKGAAWIIEDYAQAVARASFVPSHEPHHFL